MERLIRQLENPFKQALFILLSIFLVNLGALAIEGMGLVVVPRRFPWLNAASFMLFFAVLNSLYSLSAASIPRYWGNSIYGFMLLGAVAGLQAWIFSGLPISKAGSYRWIYVVVTIGYLVFLSLMTTLRKFVAFAEREEWSRPRVRNKR